MRIEKTSYKTYKDSVIVPEIEQKIEGVDVLCVDSYEEAKHLQDYATCYIEIYGVISVNAFKLMAGIPSNDDDKKFGWDSTDNWHVDRDYYESDDEYVINLKEMSIRKNREYTNTYTLHTKDCRKLTEYEIKKVHGNIN